ncbi:MAG: TIGR03013 family PEP-CTERM/XrtA system glycosyltransferase [Acetobacteraceae bacterium]|nr:TIGR03013 family PEP-CTERM/XrtA system glycosyltransferase [Acetobacteraceae bacterium]
MFAHPGLTAGRALLLLDTVLIGLLWSSVAVLCLGVPGGAAALGPLLALPAALLLFLYALGLYERAALLETRQSIARVPLAAGLAAAAAAAALSLLKRVSGSPDLTLYFIAALLCGLAAPCIARVALFTLHHRGKFRRRVMIVGAGQRAWDLVHLLRHEGRTLAYDVLFIHHPVLGQVDPRLAEDSESRIVSGREDWEAIARDFGAEQIVVAADERRGMPMHTLLACRTAGFPVYEYMRFLEKEIGRVDLKRLELSWLLYADGFAFSPVDRALKRALDVVVSALLLALALPALLGAAIAIRASDRGPVLYRQARVTQQGRVFQILKLRTMTVNSETRGAVWAAERDPRITRVGHFLRRSRLDELPQLINILRGDMSFVGPRPERPEFTRELASKLPLYEERHIVRAGLTGWAQINYPYGASLDDARSKLSYDLYYVKNFGILFDVLIILQTMRVVLWPSGVR